MSIHRELISASWRCRAALRQPIDLFDVRRFDAQLGQSLEMLAAAHRAWQAGGRRAAGVLVDGQALKDLCLTFVLPGMPSLSYTSPAPDGTFASV